MPELPDLEVFSENLQKKLQGKTVSKISAPVTKNLNVPLGKFKKALQDQAIKKIYREGKRIHIEFTNGQVLGLHMMLHGDLHIFKNKNEQKHTIMEILFADGTGLALTDWQRSARPALNPQVNGAPDALAKIMTGKYLQSQLQKTRTTIKNFLLDQKKLRGIGNAYADEILWEAGISPFSVSNKIPGEKVKALAKSIRRVLQRAKKQIRKFHPDIIAGEVRDFLLIHNPGKKQSPSGEKILVKAVGGRKTYYTKEQKLFS
jgi:formamidopyrimidine-DNA glycosylase